MARKLRETRSLTANRDDMWKHEIAEMQKSVHDLQMKVVKHSERIYELEYKIRLMDGDPQQLEMRF